MKIGPPFENLDVRCEHCGWQGVPGARKLLRLVGPTYVLFAVGAVIADTAGFVDLRTALSDRVVIGILIGLPLTMFVLEKSQRCGQCGSRNLKALDAKGEDAA